ncbi:MAG: hypothetical protein HY820_01060 [Acidobacteria bacterium]|nr:hypothetical protein [Acidobacteriota bacterium]
MLRGFIISPDQTLRKGLEARIAESGHVLALRTFERYMTVEEIERLQRAHSPQVLFLDIASDPEMLAVAAQLTRLLPGIQITALHHQCDPGLLMKLMHAAVRELLFPPFAKELYLETIARLMNVARESADSNDSTNLVFAFLPAKAGSGCSTLAMNTAVAMTRALDSKVLLADFDVNCGIARFLLKLSNAFSIQDALERVGDIDDVMWNEIVCSAGPLDVLASGPIQRAFAPATGAVRRLVEAGRRRYQAVCFDLSGNLEDYSIEALQECRRILLVVQPELAAVYLAREKVRFLRVLDLEDRVAVVLNRWHRSSPLSIADMESIIGLPVDFTVSESHDAIYKALLAGSAVEAGSDFGKELSKLAVALSDSPREKNEVTPKRRMVEYFSLLPARYTIFPK